MNLDNLIPQFHSTLTTNDTSAMAWVWASQHPLLYTVIQVMHPYLFVVVAVVAINIVNRLFRGKGR